VSVLIQMIKHFAQINYSFWKRIVYLPKSYGTVLCFLILDAFVASIPDTFPNLPLLLTILRGCTILVTLWVVDIHRRWLWIVAGCMIVSIFFTGRYSGSSANALFSHIGLLISGLFLFLTLGVIIRQLAKYETVTGETMLGAINIYILFGVTSAYVFTTIGSFSVSPFFVGVPHATNGDYLFFSFTTLTTLGYGNLIPATGFGRTCAIIEALVGQVYLVIVVARLVALWVPSRNRRHRHPT
jgi:Ion channel